MSSPRLSYSMRSFAQVSCPEIHGKSGMKGCLLGSASLLSKQRINKTVQLSLIGGSLLDFEGDAIVNAANTGGVTGFGIDQMVNRAAGDFEIKKARREFDGIPTGSAKSTPSFAHKKCRHIIHAVGPVYRLNALGDSLSEEEKDSLLSSAYRSAIEKSSEHGVKTIGFCLLSAGVFRGSKQLDDIISIAIQSIASAIDEGLAPTLEEVSIFAYTGEEKSCLHRVFCELKRCGFFDGSKKSQEHCCQCVQQKYTVNGLAIFYTVGL
uniref:Macro domain-containing protein n=1 Tax=Odontella aurita TaxID=265563 RepID=A0A7S4K9C5_9STRA